jgi:hypothetical protein
VKWLHWLFFGPHMDTPVTGLLPQERIDNEYLSRMHAADNIVERHILPGE